MLGSPDIGATTGRGLSGIRLAIIGHPTDTPTVAATGITRGGIGAGCFLQSSSIGRHFSGTRVPSIGRSGESTRRF